VLSKIIPNLTRSSRAIVVKNSKVDGAQQMIRMNG